MKLLRRKNKSNQPDIYEVAQEADQITRELGELGQSLRAHGAKASDELSADVDMNDTIIRAARSVV